MSTRTLVAFVDRVRQLSFTDPNPDKRAAYEHVLDLLARIDTGTAADLIAATAPKPLQSFPRDWPVITEDMDEREAMELRRSLQPELEAEGA
jgi:hypothetical protein